MDVNGDRSAEPLQRDAKRAVMAHFMLYFGESPLPHGDLCARGIAG